MRNPNPFTERQIRLLRAVHEKIRQIDDPDPEIIRNETYEWHIQLTKQFGKIPKIRLKPNSGQLKADLIRCAGLANESDQEKISQIRRKYGITMARSRKARLFEAEWNNIMFKIKKGVFTVGFLNQLFAFNQPLADPIKQLQQIVMDEYASQIKSQKGHDHNINLHETAEIPKNRRIKPYDVILEELE